MEDIKVFLRKLSVNRKYRRRYRANTEKNIYNVAPWLETGFHKSFNKLLELPWKIANQNKKEIKKCH